MPFAFTYFQQRFDAVIGQTRLVTHMSRSELELSAGRLLFKI